MTENRSAAPPSCVYFRCSRRAVGVPPRWRVTHKPPSDPFGDWPLCEEHSKQSAHPRDIDMRNFESFAKPSS